jgi:hypothetical protein
MRFLASLSLRFAAGCAALSVLTGAAVVSCSGDPLEEDGDSGGGSGSSRPASAAFGQWSPDGRYDDECPKSLHDEYFVLGPDGKKYPTWHPATTTDPATNRLCSFGHEHGMDPKLASGWDEIRRHYAFDANSNGTIEDSERDASGIPFGYVEEQLDAYNAANGISAALGQRQLPHTSYKIFVNNGVARSRLVNGASASYDLTCRVLYAYNQNTATADAFASNLHPLLAAIDCNQGTQAASNPVKMIVAVLVPFGRPNLFDAGPLAGPLVPVLPPNQFAVPANSAQVAPGSADFPRSIPSYAERVRDQVFVAVGRSSDFTAGLRERWDTQLVLLRNGAELARVETALLVDDPIGYYGRNAALDYTVGLCYAGLDAEGNWRDQPAEAGSIVRRPRGSNDCTALAANGAATATGARVAFDALESPFRNCTRRVVIGDTAIANGGTGTEVWYTTPFGAGAQSARFAGSVKQLVGRGATPSGITLAQTDPLAANPDGCNSSLRVHAPN